MEIPFVKYHGAGNDFVLIDLRKSPLSFDPFSLARRVCDRRHGVGADGLLLLLPSDRADYRMRIFNADGSEPSMCGNGIRCLADFVFKTHTTADFSVETPRGILKCRKLSGEIAVNLAAPSILHWPLQMTEGPVFVVNTGVPHAVLFVDDPDIDVPLLGRKIRFDHQFAPEGVNVNFAFLTADNKVILRTYERGLEAETLACGTGAAAAAFIVFKNKKLTPPVPILTRRSFGSTMEYHQQLRFCFPENSRGEMEIEMIGPTEEVFRGSLQCEINA